MEPAWKWMTEGNQIQGVTGAIVGAVLSALVALLVVTLTNRGAEATARRGRLEDAVADALEVVQRVTPVTEDDGRTIADMQALSIACTRVALAARSSELLSVLNVWCELLLYRDRVRTQWPAVKMFDEMGLEMGDEWARTHALLKSPGRMAGILAELGLRGRLDARRDLGAARDEVGRALSAVLAYQRLMKQPDWMLEKTRVRAREAGVVVPDVEAPGAP